MTEQIVLKFQNIYELEFGEKISHEEAYSECMDMFVLGKILFRPITKQDVEDLKELDEK